MNKRYFILIIFCHSVLSFANSTDKKIFIHAQTITEINNLISRVIQRPPTQFVCELIPQENGNDVFEIDARGDKVVLRGNNGVSLASAFNWYLKYTANCDYSEWGAQLNLPAKLPLPSGKIRIVATVPYRYLYNYCTFGYSMPWWNWEQWEKGIDWMAMNGFNLPLIITGQEAVWIKTFTQYGYTEKEIRQWLGSAAHLPWFFMQNMESFDGELPPNWVSQHIELAKKMINRTKAFGMNVVLQGYYGILPPGFEKRFPNAVVLTQGTWAGGLKRQNMLSPTDPLFNKISATFLKEQEKLFGKTHFYTADPFHEGGNSKGLDITDVGNRTYKAMKMHDPEAIWIKMCWQSDNAKLLRDIPADSVIALDLWAESAPYWKKGAFNGKSWIWCMVHNFGGNTELSSQLSHLASVFPKTMNNKDKGKLVGLGIAPEGLYNSPVVWELFPEFAWREDSVDLKSWIPQYLHRRYGTSSAKVNEAWEGIVASIYNIPYNANNQTPENSIIEARPLRDEKARTWSSTRQSHNILKLSEAVINLQAAAPECAASDGYLYDLVDFTRQLLGDLARPVYDEIQTSIKTKDTATFRKSTGLFLGLINDMDDLLATRKEFLLGSWISDARRWGKTPEEKNLFEYQARLLVTTWTDQPGSNLTDYSCRQWNGLMKGYYAKRWKMYFDSIYPSLAEGQTFNNELFLKNLADFERNWAQSHEKYLTVPSENVINVVRKIAQKYEPVLKVYETKVNSLN